MVSSLLSRRIRFEETTAKYADRRNIRKEILAEVRSLRHGSGDPSNDKQDPNSSSNVAHKKFTHFRKEKLHVSWAEALPAGPGLHNMGNTCFLNSTLQCLTYTPALAMFLLSRSHSGECRRTNFCTFCELEKHVIRCFTGPREKRAISPKTFVGRLKSIAKHLRVGRQEDAHEFLRYFVDSLQNSVLAGHEKIEQKLKETTVVHQIFGGYLQSQVLCTVCKYPSNTLEASLDISIDILNANTIEKALALYTKKELLCKDNRYRCSRCKTLVDAEKRMTILEAPKTLVLHLKRFDFLGRKIRKFIQYPTVLDLQPYMFKPKGKTIYNLYGVLVHSGFSTNSGHYFSYVRGPNGVWYETDDSEVRQVGLKTVLAQEPYILFYTSAASNITQPDFTAKKSASSTSTSIPSSISLASNGLKPAPPTQKSAPLVETKKKLVKIDDRSQTITKHEGTKTVTTIIQSRQLYIEKDETQQVSERKEKSESSSPKEEPAPAAFAKLSTPAVAMQILGKPLIHPAVSTSSETQSNGTDSISTDIWKVAPKSNLPSLPDKDRPAGAKVKAMKKPKFTETKSTIKTAFSMEAMQSVGISGWDDHKDAESLERKREQIVKHSNLYKPKKRPSAYDIEYERGKTKKVKQQQ
ncbi:Ubiquitin carboxyl-terminal hydrolase 36 [Chytridiales sp. JEL 0842]|nr:Ubiquitin carboxyl-terminal hydrolase 36 [Chytridiales sp. JEL 0842]